MNLVELFCGTGGFSRGAHAAGFKVAAAYDLDAILTSSYPTNFPDTKLYHRDVATLSANEIRQHVGGEIFGIFGGPPCQGFSDIGKRDPKDPRRELLRHFFRLVAEIDPPFFIMENVRGLAYRDARPVLDAALDLVRDRYDLLEPAIWDASDFGAATKRNRMLVIGVRKDLQRPFRAEHLEARKTTPTTVAQALADLSSVKAIEDSVSLEGFDRWIIKKAGRPNRYAAMVRASDRTFTGHRRTEHAEKVVERFSRVPPGGMDKVGRHPRLHPDQQCPTLRAGTGNDLGSFQSVRPIHPSEDRVITVREAARLQGFPDEHVFHPTVWHSFRMIGNSVSPIMARVVFEAVRSRLVDAVPQHESAKVHATLAVATE